MHRLVLAATAALALTASGCATAPAEKSSAGGVADRTASRTAVGAETGAKDGEKSGGKKLSWWQRITRSRASGEKPWVYGDVRPGKGLMSDDEDGFVLLRKGEAGSSDPARPAKVRRR
ncbi:MAG: hypothetical protein F4114_17720 [Rhodospirillaceae bacterium]|nr:hypothetical protein [Rhodospirillaceae bacterium]MYB15214.1 hypothetical protein [Rhodospirillaceae bacterium]MYI50907.1 hypothetical protein [Rhodospirillaceae bacterium]